MSKNFREQTYIVDQNLSDTLTWLCHHQECYDSFTYDTLREELKIYHANGMDIIYEGDYLNASYGILITANNFSAKR